MLRFNFHIEKCNFFVREKKKLYFIFKTTTISHWQLLKSWSHKLLASTRQLDRIFFWKGFICWSLVQRFIKGFSIRGVRQVREYTTLIRIYVQQDTDLNFVKNSLRSDECFFHRKWSNLYPERPLLRSNMNSLCIDKMYYQKNIFMSLNLEWKTR